MPYTTDLILFYYPNTIGSRKMLLVLYTRGISFMPRVMDVQHGEQMEPWFLEMSPLGELPLLKHGDLSFTDVDQMMLYVDQICPFPDAIAKLFPDKETELGSAVDKLVKDMKRINIPLVIYGTLFHPEMAASSTMSDEEQRRKADLVKQGKAQILELMERNPDYVSSYVEKQKAYDTFLALAQSESAVTKELEEVENVLDITEEVVNSKKTSGTMTPEMAQTWLFSIYITAADVYLMVLLHALYKAGLWERYFEKSHRKHKNLVRYFKRMKHDPLISKALPGLIK
ncbi:unnamed protein product [Ixodes pacificus]